MWLWREDGLAAPALVIEVEFLAVQVEVCLDHHQRTVVPHQATKHAHTHTHIHSLTPTCTATVGNHMMPPSSHYHPLRPLLPVLTSRAELVA